MSRLVVTVSLVTWNEHERVGDPRIKKLFTARHSSFGAASRGGGAVALRTFFGRKGQFPFRARYRISWQPVAVAFYAPGGRGCAIESSRVTLYLNPCLDA